MKILISICLTITLHLLTTLDFSEGLLTVCPQNEEQRVCGPKCPPTCETLKDEICCEVACVPGCFCVDGYIRLETHGACVPYTSCPSAGVLKFEHSEDAVYEGEKVFRITVVRINGSHGQITVHWRLIFEGGISYPEYTGKSGILEFPDGVTSQVIEIPLMDNSLRGPDISFRVQLYEASHKAEIAVDQAYTFLTIKDDDMQPGHLELENTYYTVVEREGKLEIVVVRKDGTDGKIQAAYRTKSGTALIGTDFDMEFGQVTFEEGETRKSVFITIKDDNVKEETKDFEFELFNQLPVDGTINFRSTGISQTALITIKDDDMEPGHFEIESNNYVFPESAGSVRIPILRVGGTDGEISLHYKTIIKSAVADVDFTPVEGILTFAEGQSRSFIEVKIIDDEAREPSKNFDILLFDPAPGLNVLNFRNADFKKTIRVTITDDDMRPGYFELENPSYVITEGNAVLRIGVMRLGGTDGSLTIHAKTVGITAIASKHFIPVDQELIFAENEQIKYIDIALLDNDLREPNKTLEIELYNPVPGNGVINFRNNGKVLKSVVTIIDNDMRPGNFEMESNYDVLENVGRVRVAVIRTGGSDGEIHVKYKTMQKTALENVDFIPVSGELIFLENETKKYIDIEIKNDNSREPTKVFHVHLFDSTPGPDVINFRSLDTEKISIITIKDDDMTPGYLQFEKPNYEVSENTGTLRIGVVRLDGKDGLLRMHYKSVLKSFDLSKAYNIDGTLEFKDGEDKQYIEIPIHNNDFRNPQLKFQIQLFDITPGEGVLNFRQRGSIISTLVTIKDDDMKPGYLEFLQPSYTAKESVGSLMVCVLRKEGTDGTLRIKYKTVSGTAIEGKHFRAQSGEFTFRDGAHIMHLHIHIINNDILDGDKTFYVEIYDPSSEYDVVSSRILGTVVKTTVTIVDDDLKPGRFELQESSYSVLETAKVIKVGVVRLDGSDGMMHVKYKTIPKTALPSRDFVSIDGDLLFNDKETIKYIDIQINDNEVYEPSRTFEIQLLDLIDGNGVNFRGLGSRRSSMITINDDDMKPGYLEMAKSTISVTESIGFAKVVVVRQDGSDGIIKVKYRILSVTANFNEDYEIVSPEELIFQEHETEKTIHIKIVNDAIRESTETFRVELYDQSIPQTYHVFNYRNRASTLATDVNIIDDDTMPGYLEMQVVEQVVPETIGRVKISVIRKGGTDGHLRIKYKTSDGTAKSPFDYEFDMGELEFEEGETQQNISIRIIDDTMKETTEYFFVTLFDLRAEAGFLPGGPTNLNKLTTKVVILDHDQHPGFASMEQENITVLESATTAQINVIRTGGTDGTLSVKYRTVDGTALNGADYILSSGLLSFRGGEIRQTIHIRIINDNFKEPVESFQVELLDPYNEVQPRNLGSSRSTRVDIIDDDKTIGKFQFSQSRVTVQENAFQVTLTVQRFGGSDGSITLSWTALDKTAISGLDYNPTSGLIPFADGQTEQSILISIVNDKTIEDDEEFLIALHGPSNTDVLGAVNSVTVIIKDDDGTIPIPNNGVEIYFSPAEYTIKRGERKAKLHIWRTGDLNPLSVSINTVDGTAKGGVDYRRTRGTINFYQDEKMLVVDARLTGHSPRTGEDKVFYFDLSAPSRGIIGKNKTATVIIENDGPSRLSGRIASEAESIIDANGHSSLTGSFDHHVGVGGSSLAIPSVQQFKETQVTSQQITNFGVGQHLKTLAEAISIFFVSPTITVKRSDGKVKLNIRRTGDLIPLTVLFATRDGTAKAGIDYRATRGDISFLKNEIELGVQVRLTDFNIEEKEDKNFFVDISLPSIGKIIPNLSVATVVIVNDVPAAVSGSGAASGKISVDTNGQSSSFSGSLSFRSQVKGSIPGQTLDVPWIFHQNASQLFIPPPPPQVAEQHQSCPEGMTFRHCAPACPKTCETVDDPEPCHNKCVDACFCQDGFVKESSLSNKCILPDDCIGFRSKAKMLAKLTAGAGLLGLGGLIPAAIGG